MKGDSRSAYGRAITAFTREGLSLGEFLEAEQRRAPPSLRIAEATTIVDQAILLFDQFYVHRLAKKELYGADPVARLRALRRSLAKLARTDPHPWRPWRVVDFHREMSEIFTGVRDRHMQYQWPEPFASKWASLGIEVEEVYSPRAPKTPFYVVSKIHDSLRDESRGFVEGARIHYWNGNPIQRAIELSAKRNPGGNVDARIAVGLPRLTLTHLRRAMPPDEYVVCLHYSNELDPDPTRRKSIEDRALGTKILEWRLLEARPDAADVGTIDRAVDRADEAARRQRVFLAGHVADNPDHELFKVETLEPEELDPGGSLPAYTDSSFRFAYLRIFSFDAEDMIEVIERMRCKVHEGSGQSGLVIDIRDNPGGSIQLAEQLLKELTPGDVEPLLFEFPATEAIEKLTTLPPARRKKLPTPEHRVRLGQWAAWGPSVAQSRASGRPFSEARPVTDIRSEQATRPLVNYGPMVLIFNARSYSASDMFAAGFQDNRLGQVLGTHRQSGAGGANVIEHRQLVEIAREIDDSADGGEPPLALGLEPLPGGVGMNVSLRGTVRRSTPPGKLLEDEGVMPEQTVTLTREDVVGDNLPLKRRAVELLLAEPHLLHACWAAREPEPVAEVKTRGIDRLEVDILEEAGGRAQIKFHHQRLQADEPVEDPFGNVLRVGIQRGGDDRRTADGARRWSIAVAAAARRRSIGLLIRGLRGEGELPRAGWILRWDAGSDA